MGAFLMTVIVFVLGILSTAFSRQLADEFKAWTPWFVRKIVALAVHRLPEDQRGRYSEEWLSHVAEIPGEIGKVVTSIGFYWASVGISTELLDLQHETIAENSVTESPTIPFETRFGLLPEPERNAGSFLTSVAINGSILLVVFFVSFLAKHTVGH
jgi:hypothetical protein